MTTAPNKRRATYQDLLDAPDTVIAELLDGELFTSPRRARHAIAHGNLHTLLHPTFQWGQRGPEAGGREARVQLPDEVELRVPPDWVCEIVSRSTERIDRTHKLRIYAQAGVCFAWLVNPVARTLEVFRLEHGRWVLVEAAGGEGTARLEPFDAVDIDLALVWE